MCEPCNQLAGRCLEASVQPGEAQCCKPGAGWGVEAEVEGGGGSILHPPHRCLLHWSCTLLPLVTRDWRHMTTLWLFLAVTCCNHFSTLATLLWSCDADNHATSAPCAGVLLWLVTLFVTHHTSHITHHTSHITHYTLHITHNYNCHCCTGCIQGTTYSRSQISSL